MPRPPLATLIRLKLSGYRSYALATWSNFVVLHWEVKKALDDHLLAPSRSNYFSSDLVEENCGCEYGYENVCAEI